MGSNWERVRLGDYCSKIGSGATPRGGSNVYSQYGKFALIRSQNVYNDGFKESGLVYISSDDAVKLKNVTIYENDIFINITGDSVARVCLAPIKFLPARVNQHVAIIRVLPEILDSRFVRYYLTTLKTQNELLALASAGATRNALTKEMLENLEIPLPPLAEQKRIADILSTFDDKIELNNQMNKTLESMAQALFKSWFVDFEPFGGTMPSDWREGVLEDICLFNDKSYSSKENYSFINYLDTSSITNNVISETQYLDCFNDKVPSRAKRKVKKNDIVFSTVRPNQRHYGIIGNPLKNMIASTGFSVISAKSDISYHRVYLQLTTNKSIEQLNSIAEQATSTFPAIKSDDIAKMSTYIIPTNLENKFIKLLEPLFIKIQKINEEIQELTKLRDTLLPKLISGEIQVNDK